MVEIQMKNIKPHCQFLMLGYKSVIGHTVICIKSNLSRKAWRFPDK